MASGVAVKTKRKGKGPDTAATYSELSMRQNAFILEYCRTSMSALSGSAAGILGLTGLLGFAFYFVTSFVLSLMLLLKAGSSWRKYFINRRVLFINGLFGGVFVSVLMLVGPLVFCFSDLLRVFTTYILFWTFLYGMVHVY